MSATISSWPAPRTAPSSRDSRARFSAAAAFYADHRPRYPEALLDWLVRRARLQPGSRIADVGCGTGIATRQLADRGYDVVGIEPNAAMLALARAGGGATFARGEAASTGLPDASTDLVVAGQAFHYFELEPTLAEWRRIVTPEGSCATFWYRLSPGPFKRDFHALRQRHAVTKGPEIGRCKLKKKLIVASLRSHHALCDVVDTVLHFDQRLDRSELRGRVLASSQVAGARDDRALERDVAELFDRYAEGDRVRVAHDLFAVCWRFIPAA